MDQSRNHQNNNDPQKPKRSFWTIVLISGLLLFIISSVFTMVKDGQYTQKTYSDFLAQIKEDNLAEVEIRSDRIVYMTKDEAAKPAAQQQVFYTGLPTGSDTSVLAKELDAMGVQVNRQIVEDRSVWITILSYVLMFGMLFSL